MIIVDTVTAANGGLVKIPRHHRGHLSLRTGTEVTICLLPTGVTTGRPPMEELIVSPIIFDSWRYLTRITALFRDVPGIVRKLAHALYTEKIDILYEESATIENGLYHRVEMLVDASRAYLDYDIRRRDSSRLLPRLERRLKAVCLDELVIEEGEPRLKVRKMEGLRRAWSAVMSDQTSTPGVDRSRTTIKDGTFKLPQPILEALGQKDPRLIFVSDTRDRLLRILVPRAEVDFTYIRVVHHDQIGALYRITDALAHSFNAVLTLTRLKRQREQNDVELLLYSDKHPNQADAEERKKIAESLLAQESLTDLSIEVAYPEHVGDWGPEAHPPFAGPIPVDHTEGLASLEVNLAEQSTRFLLRNRIESCISHLDSVTNSLDIDRLGGMASAARSLLVQEGPATPPKPTVFLSYAFARAERAKIIEDYLSREAFCRPTDGQEPDGAGIPFRTVIRDRIKSSQGFIAIWGDEPFSPWLLWEIGIATAFDVPICIFKHERMIDNPHLRLYPELHHTTYVDATFRETFERRWQTFKEEVSKFDRRTSDRRYPLDWNPNGEYGIWLR